MWETRYRALGERLREELAEQTGRGLTRDRDDELLLRLLGLVTDLHEWHRVDRYGQCRRCWLRRRWWHSGRKRCSVVETIECYVDEGMEFIWWQVCAQLGREVTLQETEEWVAQQRQEVGSDELDDDESDDPVATVGVEAVEVEDEGGRHRWR